MAAREVVVARTGTANLASVFAGLRRIGAEPRLTESAEEIRAADRVVIPGVGAFGAAMATLRECGVDQAMIERIGADRPTLAVCVGLQLLCASSTESPGVAGLGVISEGVERFADKGNGAKVLRIPQLGWNRVEPDASCAMLTAGYAYFANSYRLAAPPGGWNAAYAEYGGRFVAALERGSVLACQFHPELSGRWGLDLLARWLADESAKGGRAC